ncbi:E3 ubiquitin-protein ligase RBBP6-like [Cotesia glomerata]|uniref:E3 ubiquitin-protein ligase RBBP6-like n=1 Tax=Cotesia glomerata TaxID=32391 RepID=UPI001D0282DB|nr:E3 ubiquitin-protein ligase RBBP6-like [Cotesia glomerata]
MSVICTLKNFPKFYRVCFDEISIAISDVKTNVIRQMRASEDREWDLVAFNLETKTEYEDKDVVRRNTRILLQRRLIPEDQLQERKRKLMWKRQEVELQEKLEKLKGDAACRKQVDLTKTEGSDVDKIMKMMELSTADYSPSNWLKVPYKQSGPVPASYVCRRCHKPGHWVYQCTFTVNGKPACIKKARGIPQSMLKEVEGPEVSGAMLTATGKYMVYTGLKEQPPSSSSPRLPQRPSTSSSSPSPPSASPSPLMASSLPPTPSSSSTPPAPLKSSSSSPKPSMSTSSPLPPPLVLSSSSSPPAPLMTLTSSLSPLVSTSPLTSSSPEPSSSSSSSSLLLPSLSESTGKQLPNSYTPSVVDSAWHYPSSDDQNSGYQIDYEYPLYQQYQGWEPSYTDAYPSYQGYDYGNYQHHQTIDDALDAFQRYLRKKDAKKRAQRFRAGGSRSSRTHRRSPSSTHHHGSKRR